MIAMVLDGATTMGDAIAIVDCYLLALILGCGGGNGKVSSFAKRYL